MEMTTVNCINTAPSTQTNTAPDQLPLGCMLRMPVSIPVLFGVMGSMTERKSEWITRVDTCQAHRAVLGSW